METNTITASLNHCNVPECISHGSETVPLKTLQTKPMLESVVGEVPDTQKVCPPSQTSFETFRLTTTSSLFPPGQPSKGYAENPETCTLNSYKYAKPRVYVKNNFPDTDKKQLHMLRDTAILLGTKNRPAHYNEYLNTLLSVSKKLSPKGKLKRSKKVCKVNSLSLPTGSMKMLDVKVEGIMYQSLIDTGSTHCLISVESFRKLGLTCFKPISMIMKVAGSSLKNNIIGSIDLQWAAII